MNAFGSEYICLNASKSIVNTIRADVYQKNDFAQCKIYLHIV